MVAGTLITRGVASHSLYTAGMGIRLELESQTLYLMVRPLAPVDSTRNVHYVFDTKPHVMDMKYYVML